MGDFNVRKIIDAADRGKMYLHALNDIEAFEWMLQENMFETGVTKIGAEQELCLLDHAYNPSNSSLQLLEAINDEHYTNELALFNMEINLDPLDLKGSYLSEMESSLLQLLEKGQQEAAKIGEQVLMAGILPSLKYRHLQFDYMTPIERYETLSKSLSDIRGAQFEIYLQGVDELIMSLGSVLFEACNTSFQLHLQIEPDEFVNQHNWSQMIAGPVLSACVNSPILFGNELWAETRIALFKQSLDTRSAQKYLRRKLPRVYFGEDWLQKSAAELWKNDIMRFPLLLSSDNLQDAKQSLAQGEFPNLRAIRLHNGTTYTWNRLCYGFSKTKPHLRIECRYLPAGPSAIDEMANFAFWIGLMKSEIPGGPEFWKQLDFRACKSNFIKAARTGLTSVFNWFGKNYSAKELILEKLLPLAHQGLERSKLAQEDINKYLSIIEERVEAETTGSDWMVKNFRTISKTYGATIAQKELIREMLSYQQENVPVAKWENMTTNTYPVLKRALRVEELMSTNVFCIGEEDSIALAKQIMLWNNIHHLPVEDNQGNLVGLITDGMMKRLDAADYNAQFAKDIMLKELVTINAYDAVEKAKSMMSKNKLKGLPVVYKQKIVGIITNRDIDKSIKDRRTTTSI